MPYRKVGLPLTVNWASFVASSVAEAQATAPVQIANAISLMAQLGFISSANAIENREVSVGQVAVNATTQEWRIRITLQQTERHNLIATVFLRKRTPIGGTLARCVRWANQPFGGPAIREVGKVGRVTVISNLIRPLHSDESQRNQSPYAH